MTTLKQLRTQIAALQSERGEIERQPRSREDTRAAVIDAAEQLEREFSARAGLALRRIAAGYSQVAALREVFDVRDAVALVGTVGAGAVSDGLLRQIETIPEGMDAAARADRLAEIGARLDDLESQEEKLIEASEAAGAPIARRDDARPDIILAVGA